MKKFPFLCFFFLFCFFEQIDERIFFLVMGGENTLSMMIRVYGNNFIQKYTTQDFLRVRKITSFYYFDDGSSQVFEKLILFYFDIFRVWVI